MTFFADVPQPQLGTRRHISRRWRGILLVAAALSLAAGVEEMWRRSRSPAPPVPPLTPDLPDAEVRQAVQRARQKVLNEPNKSTTWGHLGMVLLAHSLHTEADFCFGEATRLDPRSPSWPYGRALIALKRSPDDAPLFLRQALSAADRALVEQQSAMRLQLAEVLLERQELDEADKLFQEEWRLHLDQPRAALGLGMIALAREDWRSAKAYLGKAQSSPLCRKRAMVQLAALARIRGDISSAANYDRETAALPDDPPWPDPFREQVEQLRVGHYTWLQQEMQLEDQHRFAEAADLYLQEAQMQPTPRAFARAGFNLARAGDYEQAEKNLREAVRLDPNSAVAHFFFAFTLFVRAETEWQRSANSPQAREWFRASIEEARRTTELQPSQAMAYLFWGRALKYLGEPATAVGPLRQGVECAPENFPLQLTLGEVLLDLGQNREAQTHLKNAQKVNSKDPRPAQLLERLRGAARPGGGL